MNPDAGQLHRVLQLGEPDEHGRQVNVPVTSLDSLVTHHPKINRNAAMVDGVIVDVESTTKRSYAFIGGEFQEIETRRTDEYRALAPDQVLLIKDFILEGRRAQGLPWARSLEVPSPVAGTVSRRDDRNGLVEISNDDVEIVARVRHLSSIALKVGDRVAYGQALGTQDNRGLGLTAGQAVHVHLEMDTRYNAQFERYMADLVAGRLLAATKTNTEAPSQAAAAHDGTFRLGESHPQIRGLQQVMHREGYRATGGGPLDQDGVYRPGMQGALLDFQRDHGIAQTGDIDPATLRFASQRRARERDLADHFQPGRTMPRLADPANAPGHPDHPDHRPGLRSEPEAPVNRDGGRSASSQLLDGLLAAARARDPDAFARALSAVARSSEAQAMLDRGRASLDLERGRPMAHEAPNIHGALPQG